MYHVDGRNSALLSIFVPITSPAGERVARSAQSKHGATCLAQIGSRLRVRRAHLGLSINSVARELGIGADQYLTYETGAKLAPELLLARIAEYFGVPALLFSPNLVLKMAAIQQAKPRLRSISRCDLEDLVDYLARCATDGGHCRLQKNDFQRCGGYRRGRDAADQPVTRAERKRLQIDLAPECPPPRAADARRLGLKLEACGGKSPPWIEPQSPRRECRLRQHLFGLTQPEFTAYCIGNQNLAVMGLKSAKMSGRNCHDCRR